MSYLFISCIDSGHSVRSDLFEYVFFVRAAWRALVAIFFSSCSRFLCFRSNCKCQRSILCVRRICIHCGRRSVEDSVRPRLFQPHFQCIGNMCSVPNRCEWLLTHLMCAGRLVACKSPYTVRLCVCVRSERTHPPENRFISLWMAVDRMPPVKNTNQQYTKKKLLLRLCMCMAANEFLYFCRFYFCRFFVFRLCART